MLLNVAKYQGYSFYCFWLIKGKLPPTTRLGLRKPLGELRHLHCHSWEISGIHLNVLITFITAAKLIFIEHTKMGWGYDLLFKNKYRPLAKNYSTGILNCLSKTRKYNGMLTWASKKITLFRNKSKWLLLKK